MNKLKLLFPWRIVLAYLLSACDTDYMVYEESKDRVYFSVILDLERNTVYSSFSYWELSDQLTVSYLVHVMGFPAEKEREVKVEIVDSLTTAIEGKDFILPEKITIPAGSVSVTSPLIVWNRRQEDDPRPDMLSVGLTIVENESFMPALGYTLLLCYTHGAINKPNFWSEARLGPFSVGLLNRFLEQYNSLKESDPVVYEYICKYTGEHWSSDLWEWPSAVDYLVVKYIVTPLYYYYEKHPEPGVAIPPIM